jgi:prepilin-type N-terminal cleavage/methylation domain-containing protein
VSGPRTLRPGFSLLELITAMTLGAITAAVLGGVLLVQLRLAREAGSRSISADALRTAVAVLHGEVRRGAPADVRAASRDSIAVRAFRGSAVVCAVDHDRLYLAYRGDRLPDPRKDSLLLVDGSGSERAFAVLDVQHTASPCPDANGSTGLRVRVSAPAPAYGVALVYESGSYYLSTRALRYRLGAEGRQPLTPELFVQGHSSFSVGASGIAYRLRTSRGDSAAGTAAFGSVPR